MKIPEQLDISNNTDDPLRIDELGRNRRGISPERKNNTPPWWIIIGSTVLLSIVYFATREG